MKPEMKKLIIANLPYLLFVYLFGKLGQTYRLAAGADLSEKLLHLADGFSLAFESTAPSFHLFDLAAASFRIQPPDSCCQQNQDCCRCRHPFSLHRHLLYTVFLDRNMDHNLRSHILDAVDPDLKSVSVLDPQPFLDIEQSEALPLLQLAGFI